MNSPEERSPKSDSAPCARPIKRIAYDWAKSPSIRRDTIADDANPAAPFAPEKGLPLGISRKEGATVSNRARADSLAKEIHGRGLGRSKRKHRGHECERSQNFTHTQPPVNDFPALEPCHRGAALLWRPIGSLSQWRVTRQDAISRPSRSRPRGPSSTSRRPTRLGRSRARRR